MFCKKGFVRGCIAEHPRKPGLSGKIVQTDGANGAFPGFRCGGIHTVANPV